MFLINLLKSWFINYKKRPGIIDEIDDHDFGAHVIAGHVNKNDLTNKEFFVMKPILIDQSNTDFCLGCSRAYGAQATEKRKMSWAGAYANACRYLNYIPEYGTSIKAICAGAVKFGTPEEDFYKYSSLKGRNWFANWRNMTDNTINNAKNHKAQSFFRIIEPWGMDRFDTFRAYLNKFKDKKIVIHTGIDAHAVTLIGQKIHAGELKLYGPDSYGKKSINYRIGASEQGFRYFNRKEANQLFNGYIIFDMERSLAEILNVYNGKIVKEADINDCYLIKDGKKYYISSEPIAWSHGYLLAPYDEGKLTETIEKDDLNKIPSGDNLKIEDGKNYWIVKRISEKYKIKL